MAEHRSKVFRAFKKTDSLRTTIPQVVVGMLGVEPGSELVWVTEPGSVTVTVRVARKR
jgi:antitoxin component of MazEF toxin-antitoxin module